MVCDLCKKKLGFFGGPVPNNILKKIKPYAGIFDHCFAPGAMSLCDECVRMTTYLYAYKWGGKGDNILHPEINNSDKCSVDEVKEAHNYVSARINNIDDKRYKDLYRAFYDNALKISEEIIKHKEKCSDKRGFAKKLDTIYRSRKRIIGECLDIINSSEEAFTSGFPIICKINDEICFIHEFYDQLVDDELFNLEYDDALQSVEDASQTVISDINKLEKNIKIEILRLKIKNIKYYKVEGDVHFVSDVHGGGGSGGGTNLSGAIIGGALFGAAGAIVGSQIGTEVKINPVITDIIKRDGRFVRLVYNDVENVKEYIFTSDEIEIFSKLIPEKEYGTVMLNKSEEKAQISNNENTAQQMANKNNVVEELRQYKSLLDEGIITQEEFDNKKKELLSL